MDSLEISWFHTDLDKIPNLADIDLKKSLKNYIFYELYVKILTFVFFFIATYGSYLNTTKNPEKILLIGALISLIITVPSVSAALYRIKKISIKISDSVSIRDDYFSGILAYKYLPKGTDTIIAGFWGGIVFVIFIFISLFNQESSTNLISSAIIFSYFGLAVMRSIYIIFQPLSIIALISLGLMLYLGMSIPYENHVYDLFMVVFFTILPVLQNVAYRILRKQ